MPALVRTPTAEAISEHVQSLIFEGTLTSGTRLDREQLARDVGTSQIPVREALLRLEAEGSIVIEPHRGAFVAATTEDTVREHWEVMGLISGFIAANVADRHDTELIAELRRLVEQMDAERHAEAFNEVALQAARLVNHGGATAKLRRLLRRFGRQVPGNFYARIPGAMDCARSGYRELLEAIEAGDGERAARAARVYMQTQGSLVAKVLRKNGVLGGIVNDKVYIHEFIDIIGHNRARYMHHMTANFSPAAQEDRNQRCYGVWGVVGSTGRWPQVVNIWEEDGLDGLASSFRHELGHASLQDPKLATWWAEAAKFRSGGTDRLLAPAPWSKTITELCADGVTGETYAHEQIGVPRGTSSEFLETVANEGAPALERFGWQLAGAWETLLGDDSECFLLWSIPTWEQWADAENGRRTHPPLVKWRQRLLETTTSFSRILLVDAPLSPFRTHRQPAYTDQTDWED